MQRPLINVPNLPRIFQEEGPDDRQVNRILAGWCDLSEHFHEILSYNHRARNELEFELGGEEDIKERLRLYEKLLIWRASLVDGMGGGRRELSRSLHLQYAHPSPILMKVGHFANGCRLYFSNIVVELFRLLDSLEINLPNLGSPRAICVRHCANMMAHLGTYEKHYPQEMTRGFVGALYICYVAGIYLVGNLNREPASREPFTEVCRRCFIMSRNWPLGTAVLKGLRALSLQLKVQLPEESLPYFEEAPLIVHGADDVPISYVIPQQDEMTELLSDDGTDTTSVGVELGKIIAKWSAFSI